MNLEKLEDELDRKQDLIYIAKRCASMLEKLDCNPSLNLGEYQRLLRDSPGVLASVIGIKYLKIQLKKCLKKTKEELK